MRFFAGMSSTDYQDILRAIGRWLDQSGLRFIRLVEVDNGIVVQGVATPQPGDLDRRYQTRFFTDEDVRDILVAAYQRRQADAKGATTGS